MTLNYAFLAVEGPTDEAVVSRALKLLGFKKFDGTPGKLDPFWKPLVPTYPTAGGNLYARLPMPTILHSATTSVAIMSGEGSRLPTLVKATLTNSNIHPALQAFCVVADADDNSPDAVCARYREKFKELFPAFPSEPSRVVAGSPSLGMYVFPDGKSKGVVEHLALECGGTAYPTLLQAARAYVAGFSDADRRKEKWAPFDHQKAEIATVASLLKPGKTNAMTIHDNDWISHATRATPMLAALLDFLGRLLAVPVVGSPAPESQSALPPAQGVS